MYYESERKRWGAFVRNQEETRTEKQNVEMKERMTARVFTIHMGFLHLFDFCVTLDVPVYQHDSFLAQL